MLGRGKPRVPFVTELGTFDVKVSTNRLECLRRNQSCVWCGKKGSFFRLETQISEPPAHPIACYVENCPWCSLHHKQPVVVNATPHLNLYHRSKNGGIYMMTQDHILPRSRGGSDRIENLQTMCDSCNAKKGNKLDEDLNQEVMACPLKGIGVSHDQERLRSGGEDSEVV